MDKYLKMSDYFSGAVSDSRGHVAASYGLGVEKVIFMGKHASAAAHAINSHDELVAEVERLRARVAELEEFTYHFCDNSYNVDLGGGDCTATTCEAKEMAHNLDNRAWPDLWPGH